MLSAQRVGLAEDLAYPLNPPLLKQQGHIQEKQGAMKQRPEWNNAANEEKENSHYFTHLAPCTNFHPHFN